MCSVPAASSISILPGPQGADQGSPNRRISSMFLRVTITFSHWDCSSSHCRAADGSQEQKISHLNILFWQSSFLHLFLSSAAFCQRRRLLGKACFGPLLLDCCPCGGQPAFRSEKAIRPPRTKTLAATQSNFLAVERINPGFELWLGWCLCW